MKRRHYPVIVLVATLLAGVVAHPAAAGASADDAMLMGSGPTLPQLLDGSYSTHGTAEECKSWIHNTPQQLCKMGVLPPIPNPVGTVADARERVVDFPPAVPAPSMPEPDGVEPPFEAPGGEDLPASPGGAVPGGECESWPSPNLQVLCRMGVLPPVPNVVRLVFGARQRVLDAVRSAPADPHELADDPEWACADYRGEPWLLRCTASGAGAAAICVLVDSRYPYNVAACEVSGVGACAVHHPAAASPACGIQQPTTPGALGGLLPAGAACDGLRGGAPARAECVATAAGLWAQCDARVVATLDAVECRLA